MKHVQQCDPQIAELIDAERDRQQNSLELIASENHASPAVIEAMGAALTDKYAEGYPGKRYYGGCEAVDRLEQICIDRARRLFGAPHANVQPHCGTTANMAAYMAALAPGETILAMDLSHGGHLSHGMKVNFSGKLYEVASYGVDERTETIDMDALEAQAKKVRPKMIVAGASAYPRIIDFQRFGEIAASVDALLLADIAHIAGLVAAGVHPTPVGSAQFVTSTTHKTLRGPRGGLILASEDWARKVDSAVFPGCQGGPLEHVIAAKAVAFGEALTPAFKDYARQILANATALAEALAERGWRIVSGGTDNHLLLVDLRSRDEELTGHDAQIRLEEAGIVCNKNKIPFDPRPPMQASGLRFGTPALTTRGMGAEQMTQLAGWIDAVLSGGGDADLARTIRAEVTELCTQFPIPVMR